MADYELVAGTVLQFPMSVSCQRNLAYRVLKQPPLGPQIPPTKPEAVIPESMIHETEKECLRLISEAPIMKRDLARCEGQEVGGKKAECLHQTITVLIVIK